MLSWVVRSRFFNYCRGQPEHSQRQRMLDCLISQDNQDIGFSQHSIQNQQASAEHLSKTYSQQQALDAVTQWLAARQQNGWPVGFTVDRLLKSKLFGSSTFVINISRRHWEGTKWTEVRIQCWKKCTANQWLKSDEIGTSQDAKSLHSPRDARQLFPPPTTTWERCRGLKPRGRMPRQFSTEVCPYTSLYVNTTAARQTNQTHARSTVKLNKAALSCLLPGKGVCTCSKGETSLSIVALSVVSKRLHHCCQTSAWLCPAWPPPAPIDGRQAMHSATCWGERHNNNTQKGRVMSERRRRDSWKATKMSSGAGTQCSRNNVAKWPSTMRDIRSNKTLNYTVPFILTQRNSW